MVVLMGSVVDESKGLATPKLHSPGMLNCNSCAEFNGAVPLVNIDPVSNTFTSCIAWAEKDAAALRGLMVKT